MRSLIIGLGRRGGDCASHLTFPSTDQARVLWADTDTDDLGRRAKGSHLRLGTAIDDEKFARNDPSFSYKATMSDRSAIEEALDDVEIVILLSGLGGGTGAGGAKAIAEIARDAGKTPIACVTRPLGIEGEKRVTRARRGSRELARRVELTVSFHQDQLLPLVEHGTRVREVVGIADELIAKCVEGLVAHISEATDLGGVEALIGEAEEAIFGFGVSETGVLEATSFVPHSPFLQNVSLGTTTSLVVTIRSREVLGDDDVAEAIAALRSHTSAEADIAILRIVDSELENAVQVGALLVGTYGDPATKLEGYFIPGASG